MVNLVPYDDSFEDATLKRIFRFFDFHKSLVVGSAEDSAGGPPPINDETRQTLASWQKHPNRLYVIMYDNNSAGFVRINFRGPIVAWIEDIYVDEEHRGRGIATSAIRLTEDMVRQEPGYQAICFDVALRNTAALKLYHKLGYTDISMVTLRKEFNESRRNNPINLLDLDFKY